MGEFGTSATRLWIELTDMEKIERLREQVKSMQQTIRYLQEALYQKENEGKEYF